MGGIQSLQIAAFLFTVCHVVLLVQDWFTDLGLYRYGAAAPHPTPCPHVHFQDPQSPPFSPSASQCPSEPPLPPSAPEALSVPPGSPQTPPFPPSAPTLCPTSPPRFLQTAEMVKPSTPSPNHEPSGTAGPEEPSEYYPHLGETPCDPHGTPQPPV